MKMLRGLAFSTLLFGMTALHAQVSTLDGLPVPWPFPWAKECPVNWQEMEGTYALSDSQQSDQIIMRISVVRRNGMQLIRVSRFTPRGIMIFDGTTYVTARQKVIRLYLSPVRAKGPPVWAIIKLHFQSWHTNSCQADQLIPILTVQNLDPDSPDQIQYKMVKVPATK